MSNQNGRMHAGRTADLASFHRDDDRDRGYRGPRDDDREHDDRRPRSWTWRPDEREARDDRADWRGERRFDDRDDDRGWRDRGARFSESERFRDPYGRDPAMRQELLRGAVRDHDESSRDLSYRADRMYDQPGPRRAPGDDRGAAAGSDRPRIGPQRGPHHGKGPIGFHRSDERIRELVCEALTDDGEVDATRIEVRVSGGEVTLTGTIEDRRMKRLAEDCVEAVPGVRDVHNQLRLGEPADRGGPAIEKAERAERGEKHDPSDRKHRPS